MSEPRKYIHPEDILESDLEFFNRVFQSNKVDRNTEVNESEVLVKIKDIPIIARGDITTVTGQKKSAKSISILAMLTPINKKSPFIRMSREQSKKALYIDTEQSHRSIKKKQEIIQRSLPENQELDDLFDFIALREFSTKERKSFIKGFIECDIDFYDIIIIDGIRDLEPKINDDEKAQEITELVMATSKQKEVAVIIVLHQNKNNSNMRGHIGTEAANKSITTVICEKGKERSLFKIKFEDCRDGEIEMDMDLRFENLSEHTFVSILDDQEIKRKRSLKEAAILIEIFGSKEVMKRSEIINSYIEYGEEKSVAESKIKTNMSSGWLLNKYQHQDVKHGYYKLNIHVLNQQVVFKQRI